MGLGRGRGQLIYYNCRCPWHYVRDYTNPTRISRSYCEQFDHELIDFPTLIAEIREKRVVEPTTTQNVLMMRSKPRKEDPQVNMVLRSGTATRVDRRDLSKEGTGVGKETNLEARESFTKVSTLGSRDQPEMDKDPSMMNTFLETCIKFLRDSGAVKGLQKLINRCTRWSEPCVIQKLERHSSRTGREM